MVEDKLKYLRSDFDRQTISSHLDELENLLGRLDSNNAELAEMVLNKFDLIHAEIKKNNPDPQIPFAYQTQLDYVEKRIRSNAQVIVNALGGTEKYSARRDQEGKKKNHGGGISIVILSKSRKRIKEFINHCWLYHFIVLAVIFIYQQFFAPPPEVQARIRHEQTADRLISAGDLDSALIEIQSALSYEPDNYELLIWQGVIISTTW